MSSLQRMLERDSRDDEPQARPHEESHNHRKNREAPSKTWAYSRGDDDGRRSRRGDDDGRRSTSRYDDDGGRRSRRDDDGGRRSRRDDGGGRRSTPTSHASEWFSESPKQWMMNAFQNHRLPTAKIKTSSRGSSSSRGTSMRATIANPFGGSRIVGAGRNAKEAEHACAMAVCRLLDRRGLLQRAVSTKQRGKKKKKKKKKTASGGGAQRQQQQQATSSVPFVVPFAQPTFSGANVAKKVKEMGNGQVPRLHLSGLSERVLERALESRWVDAAPRPEPPKSYDDFSRALRSRAMRRRRRQRLSAAPSQSQSRFFSSRRQGRQDGEEEHGDDDDDDDEAGSEEECDGPGVVAPAPPARGADAIAEQRAGRKRRQDEPRVQRMLQQRRKLPVFMRRAEVLEAVLSTTATVAVVAGETGSGKTTQVPQFLLDELLDRGDDCAGGEIVVTQPRRLAAIAVATRVAEERGERVGDSVGYTVRLESVRATAPCHITFCTTGILLRRMQGRGGVDGIVHVVVDEVHERDLNTDFLLVLIARLVRVAPNLRVTLMSATLDAKLFADYFTRALRRHSPLLGVGGAEVHVRVPTLEVKGRMFPVEEVFLDEALSQAPYLLDDLSRCPPPRRRQNNNGRQSAFGAHDAEETPEATQQVLAATSRRSRCSRDVLDALRGPHYAEEQASPALVAAVVAWLCQEDPLGEYVPPETPEMPEPAAAAAAADDDDKDDEENVAAAPTAAKPVSSLQRMLDGGGSSGSGGGAGGKAAAASAAGAILVFLPGTQDIKDVQAALDSPPFAQALRDRAVVLPLHGSLSTAEQRRVFERPARGVRKIVLATNVAESSITIDDVAYVVNSGKSKEKRHDPSSGVSTLQAHWASAANNKQRAGRAGRVRPGMCVNLYLQARAARFQKYQRCEMSRVPLDDLILTIKALGLGKAAPVLAEALEPPETGAVTAALEGLRGMGALDSRERLTPLGRSLALLPLEPRQGKMLVLAAAVGVLEAALTVAASTASRGPFLRPMHARDEADAAIARLAGSDAYSDHAVLVAGFSAWSEAKRRGSREERRWCDENFVSGRTMESIDRTREQLRGVLRKCGIFGEGRDRLPTRSRGLSLLRAVIAGSLWPNVAIHAGVQPSRDRDGKHSFRAVLHGEDNCGLQMHPSSSVAKLPRVPQPLTVAIFGSKLMTSQLYVDKVTLVSPLTAVLFGGHSEVFEGPGVLKRRRQDEQQQRRRPASGLARLAMRMEDGSCSSSRSRQPEVERLPAGQVGVVQSGWLAVIAKREVSDGILRLRAGINRLVAEHVGGGGRGGGGRGGGDQRRGGGRRLHEEARDFVDAVGELLEEEDRRAMNNKTHFSTSSESNRRRRDWDRDRDRDRGRGRDNDVRSGNGGRGAGSRESAPSRWRTDRNEMEQERHDARRSRGDATTGSRRGDGARSSSRDRSGRRRGDENRAFTRSSTSSSSSSSAAARGGEGSRSRRSAAAASRAGGESSSGGGGWRNNRS